MHFTAFVLLGAAALGASAHPSAHLHQHQHAHDKRAQNFYMPGHKQRPTTTSTTTAAKPTTTSAAAAAPSAAAPAAAVPSKSSSAPEFCTGGHGFGSQSKRASLDDIASCGEQGTGNGCKWASNIIQIDPSVASQYKYVMNVKNVDSQPWQLNCGNKCGPDGGIDGSFFDGLVITVPAGASTALAFNENSQGQCIFGPGTIKKAPWGQNADCWAEFDFGSKRNGYYSGADISMLVAQAAGMRTPNGAIVCNGQPSSFINGTPFKAYVAGMEAVDGEGANIAPGPVTCQLTMG